MESVILELLTEFDDSNLFQAYDIAELKIRLTLQAEDRSFTKLAFHIVVSEPFIDDELGHYEDCLVSPESSDQQAVVDQQVQYPLQVTGTETLVINVPLASTQHGSANFLDTLKSFPDYVIYHEEFVELFVKVILTNGNGEETTEYIIIKLRNPWFGEN